ncbi:Hpt domain-containing protein [Bdellovibrionota bacterium FG-1]
MIEIISSPSAFDRDVFEANFVGMEDLALEAIMDFLDVFPQLVAAIDVAMIIKAPVDLELAAHTLKGALAIFYAEPARLLAWRLEQMGCGVILDDERKTLNELSSELARLSNKLQEWANTKKVKCTPARF